MAQYNPFNPTSQTWGQIANKQAATEMQSGALNSNELILQYDPIYNKLVSQISYTMYRKLRVMQKWENLGRTAPMNAYPGILREIYMTARKGQNFAMDADTRPTTLNSYEIVNDIIDVRYHSAQFRWMYPWTIFDEELRRFSGGNGTTIAELTEMKMINSVNARNRFMDALRKETFFNMTKNVATEFATNIDISNFATLSEDNAKLWLNIVDNLLFELEVGTSLYNKNNQFMQTQKADLQLVIPRQYFMNVMRRAFPDMYNPTSFEGILPSNLILIDTLGGDQLSENGSTPAAVTYDNHGMSLQNWTPTNSILPGDENVQAVIMHRDCIGFEDNLNETLFGPKDIEKLATPVRSHYWTKAYYTDLLPAIKLTKGE